MQSELSFIWCPLSGGPPISTERAWRNTPSVVAGYTARQPGASVPAELLEDSPAARYRQSVAIPDVGNSIELPSRGLIDMHNHLLPGIDDGCSHVDESVACVRELIQAGYAGAVCTPHGGPRMAPLNTPQRISEVMAVLRRALEAEGVRFPILPGSELSLTPDLLAWVQGQGVQALGVEGDARARRCGAVLFDYWGSEWTKDCDAFVDYLLGQDLTPILAHPERMNIHDGWLGLLERLGERGVLLQGNLRPLVGRDGLLAQYRAEQLLDLDRYEYMALDAHHLGCLVSRLEGGRRLRAGWGRRRTKQLLETAPRRLVALGQSLAGASDPTASS